MKTCEVVDCQEYAPRELCRYHGKAVRQGRIAAQPHWYTQPNPQCTVRNCDRRSESRKAPLVCHVHKEHIRNGRDLDSVRGKEKQGSQKDRQCESPGCLKNAHSKGLCPVHYSQQRTVYKWDKCDHPGCEVRTAKPQCVEHRPARVGNPLRDVSCLIPGCQKTFRTLKSVICSHHRTVLRNKGLTLDQFLALFEITECQACGHPHRLVIDHVHGHHPRSDQMCPECIRGRLCSHCNTALGLLSDSVERIEGLKRYLLSNPPGGLVS